MTDLFHHEADLVERPLRPYQAGAIASIKESFQAGNKRVVLHLPTGGGKTKISGEIIKLATDKGRSVIFTAPAISLINQTVASFRSDGIGHIGVMQASHPMTDPTARVQVASVQTLAQRQIPEAGLVIVDEAHQRAKVIEDLMAQRPGLHMVGLSATPWAKGMGLHWQDLIMPCTLAGMIDDGYLSRYVAYGPDTPDMDGVKISKGDYAIGQTADVMTDRVIVGRIVENWMENGDNRPTLLFGVNCAHARHMHEQFLRAGVSSAYVDAHVDTVERQAIEREYRAGGISVVCSVRTMIVGVDWPVSCIIDAAPTRSEMLHVQKIGRGLRINPGTEDLVIFDHAGNCCRLGLPTEINHDRLCTAAPGEKVDSDRQVKLPTECSKCSVLFSGRVCPSCGYERRPPPNEIETVDGKLVRIAGIEDMPDLADKIRFYGMALHLADQRGYKEGFAAFKYREKYGDWPNRLPKLRVEPDRSFLNWEKARRIEFAKAKEGAAA